MVDSRGSNQIYYLITKLVAFTKKKKVHIDFLNLYILNFHKTKQKKKKWKWKF
jgi:hypothetical protein